LAPRSSGLEQRPFGAGADQRAKSTISGLKSIFSEYDLSFRCIAIRDQMRLRTRRRPTRYRTVLCKARIGEVSDERKGIANSPGIPEGGGRLMARPRPSPSIPPMSSLPPKYALGAEDLPSVILRGPRRRSGSLCREAFDRSAMQDHPQSANPPTLHPD